MDNNFIPFLQRKDLDFEQGTTFALRLNIQSSSTSRITVTGATKSGKFTFAKVSAGDDSVETTSFGLNDIPIWVSIQNPLSDANPGAIYATLTLMVDGDPMYEMISGYVSSNGVLSWPIASNRPSEGHIGEIGFKSSADPAAGSELTITTPNKLQWKIKAIRFTLVTDANAATRQVHLFFNSNGSAMSVTPLVTQAASLTRVYTFMPGIQPNATVQGTEIWTPIPDNLIIGEQQTIVTVTDNKQVGDNYSAAKVDVEIFKTLIL